MKLNQKAVEHAKQLIENGKYEPGDKDWSEHQPSTEEENAFIESRTWEEYSKWYLGLEQGEDIDADEKQRYAFPYGDFEKVHRGGLIAAKQRAGQYDHYDIEDAANKLMEMIDEKEE